MPENETNLTLTLEIKDEKYSYNYSLAKTVSNAKAINIGDTIEEPDFATLAFKDAEYTEDVVPSNTNGAYSHYQVDNPSNTYLVLKFDITNYMSTGRDCETFVGIKTLFMNKYSYSGFVVVEDEDGAGFSSYDNIDPLTTRTLYYINEVPKSVTANEATLTIFFNGKEYIYTHQTN